MKSRELLFISLTATGLIVSTAFAAGSATRGKALFNDPSFAGGVRACSSCHPKGRGLENAGSEKMFHIAGGTQKSLEEAVNTCIVTASGGKAIDPASAEMKDIVAYIKSL